jgi:hypothetical protein
MEQHWQQLLTAFWKSMDSFLNPVVRCKVYSIQHYVIKFVSYLQQVGGFPQVFRFPPPQYN